MNQWVSRLLMVCLVLFLLPGCDTQTWKAPQSGDESGNSSSQSAPSPSPSEEESSLPDGAEEPASDPLDFADEDALRTVLEGEWVYCPPASDIPAAWITFSKDGKFHVRLENPEDGAILEENGVYQLDWWDAGSEEAPDMLCLTFSENFGGSISAQVSSGGDYLLSQKTLCDGEIVLGLMQLNNGDTMFSLYFSDMFLVLKRHTGWQPQGEVRKSETFYASAWKVDYEAQTLWLDDVTLDDEYANTGRYEALPYQASPKLDLASLPSHLLVDGGVWIVQTDKMGRIEAIEPYIEENDELAELVGATEEEAMNYLSQVYEVQEYLEQGMTMLSEGKIEVIEGENCLVIALGTEHEEHFVHELFYAVSGTGMIYSYDLLEDSWNVVGMG